ncbi:MAG TPA: tetratricopeptide repeat protein [Gammaproteobacteria bacterium]|nr:tetratricopeptide repeat protein [Gammaproteobacteria bacterium]
MAAENTRELTKLATAGDKAAREKLAVIYAEAGSLKAKEELALLYADGGVVIQKDEKKAFGLYLELALKGIPEWQCNLAQAYDFGEGTERDLKEAIRWYLAAAIQGYVQARYNLGVIYEVEEDVKNIPRAARYYFSAADDEAKKALTRLAKKGHFIAQFYLAMLDQSTNKKAVVALLNSNPIEFSKILSDKTLIDSMVALSSDPTITPTMAEVCHELGVLFFERADDCEKVSADSTELVAALRSVSKALFAGLLQNKKGLEDGTTEFYFDFLEAKQKQLYPYSPRAAAAVDFFPEALPDAGVTTSIPAPKVSSPVTPVFHGF